MMKQVAEWTSSWLGLDLSRGAGNENLKLAVSTVIFHDALSALLDRNRCATLCWLIIRVA
ncbi:MAG: hypothetical protein AMR96_04220 [Candidatus Adiutrix intracellularis]|nr:MAG: hypothetical protein AMR96_04220 [Candidatus Adiutrix intracellularis]